MSDTNSRAHLLPETLQVRGAREHNLRGVDVDLPHRNLTVFTGVSGSGKSSLAFATIYAEGQRRQLQSMSTFARQFMHQMDKPDVDHIGGLCSAVAVDQRSSASRSPRSTVGTVTEVYDLLRVVYARIGHPHCTVCGTELDEDACPQGHDTLLPEMTNGGVLLQSSLRPVHRLPGRRHPPGGGPHDPGRRPDPLPGGGRDHALAAHVHRTGADEGPGGGAAGGRGREHALGGTLRGAAARSCCTAPTSRSGPGSSTSRATRSRTWCSPGWCPGSTSGTASPAGRTSANWRTTCGRPLRRVRGRQAQPRPARGPWPGAASREVTALPVSVSLRLFQELEGVRPGARRRGPGPGGDRPAARPSDADGAGVPRPGPSGAPLSGGESQRIRLAGLLGTDMFGLLYVLDEPTTGLHPRDIEKLVATLQDLRDQGNTVLIVEHDHQMIKAADWVVELGPAAGEHGGELLYSGPVEQLLDDVNSPTGGYTSGTRGIAVPASRPASGAGPPDHRLRREARTTSPGSTSPSRSAPSSR